MLQGLTRKVRGLLQRSARDPVACTPVTDAASAAADAPGRPHHAALDLLRGGHAAAALAAANEAIAATPGYAEAYNAAGLALRALGRAEEAASSFQRAVDIRPDYAAALANHGIACLEL